MDLFNKKKVAELELVIKNNEKTIKSLKSDVCILERENHEMKLRHGEASTMSARVTSPESRFISSAKIKRGNPSEATVPTITNNVPTITNNSSSDLLTGAVIGAAVVDTLHESKTESSNSDSSSE